MNRYKIIINLLSHSIFVLQILLLLLLFFEPYLKLSTTLQVVGRMHPLWLHLPIGFIVLLVLFLIIRNEIPVNTYIKIQSFSLHCFAFSAALAAIMGLFLVQEGDYNIETIQWHKWTGAGVSFFAYGLLLWHNTFANRYNIFSILLLVNLALVMLAGHLGGSITHGENYLLEPFIKKELAEGKVISPEMSVFEAAIEPILKEKCYACHNKSKSKGALIMTSLEDLMKGGKHGAIWQAGNVDSSQIIQRLNLPLQHKEHMPPKGKSQLTTQEIEIIREWIAEGANTQQKIANVLPSSHLVILINDISRNRATTTQKTYPFAAVSSSVIEQLNTPFRTVRAVAKDLPALEATIFVREAYEASSLKELASIKEQLVVLNLSKLPITDEDLTFISQFPNIEKLILNGTDIVGKNLASLKSCKQLEEIALSNTPISFPSLQVLSDFVALKKVYLWNTSITEEEMLQLKQQMPQVAFELGFIPDEEEQLKLSMPILKNKSTILDKNEKIILENKIPNAAIHYTTNGTTPDSLSTMYKAPIELNTITLIRTKTYKTGWLSSDVASFLFFPKGFMPDSIILLTDSNKRYRGNGAQTLADYRKGNPNNHGGRDWLGYQEESLVALVDFGLQAPVIQEIVGSFAKVTWAEIFPPSRFEIWAGNAPNELNKVGFAIPEQPKSYETNEIVAVSVKINATSFRYYKIVAIPIQQIPTWHSRYKKERKGWVFMDEVFFY